MDNMGVRVTEDSSEKEILEIFLDFKLLPGGSNLPDSLRRMLNIARVVVLEPDILFIDELGLKYPSFDNEFILRYLAQNLPKTTIIMNACNIDSAKCFDKVAVMEKGVVKEYECPEKLVLDKKSEYLNLLKKSPLNYYKQNQRSKNSFNDDINDNELDLQKERSFDSCRTPEKKLPKMKILKSDRPKRTNPDHPSHHNNENIDNN